MNEDYCIKCKAPILFREQPCPGCGHKTCPLKKENNIFKINGYITAITFFINKIIINVLAILLGIAVLLLCLKFNLINEKSIISNNFGNMANFIGSILLLPLFFINIKKRLNAIDGHTKNYIKTTIFIILSFVPFLSFLLLVYLVFKKDKLPQKNLKKTISDSESRSTEKTKFCSNCDSEISNTANFCNNCGGKLKNDLS